MPLKSWNRHGPFVPLGRLACEVRALKYLFPCVYNFGVFVARAVWWVIFRVATIISLPVSSISRGDATGPATERWCLFAHYWGLGWACGSVWPLDVVGWPVLIQGLAQEALHASLLEAVWISLGQPAGWRGIYGSVTDHPSLQAASLLTGSWTWMLDVDTGWAQLSFSPNGWPTESWAT